MPSVGRLAPCGDISLSERQWRHWLIIVAGRSGQESGRNRTRKSAFLYREVYKLSGMITRIVSRLSNL